MLHRPGSAAIGPFLEKEDGALVEASHTDILASNYQFPDASGGFLQRDEASRHPLFVRRKKPALLLWESGLGCSFQSNFTRMEVVENDATPSSNLKIASIPTVLCNPARVWFSLEFTDIPSKRVCFCCDNRALFVIYYPFKRTIGSFLLTLCSV
jgi:hypothetical protein